MHTTTRNLLCTAAVATSLLVCAPAAHAQLGGGLSPGGITGGPGVGTAGSGPTLGTQPNAMPVMPQVPTLQWVPGQRQYDPAVGRFIDVPPHNAERLPDGRIIQPPMTIPSPSGGPPVLVPGGANPVPGITPCC